MTNRELLIEYLRNRNMLNRVLQFRESTEETEDLRRMMAFIDETIAELGEKGRALTEIYINGCTWLEAACRLNTTTNTIGRWRDIAIRKLLIAVSAAGIDLTEFIPLMGIGGKTE